MDVPYARFFKGSPVLEVLDFLERLAPFTDPDMILRDEKPLMVATIQRKRKDLTAPVAESAGEEDAAETPTEKASGEPEPFDALKALRESVGR